MPARGGAWQGAWWFSASREWRAFAQSSNPTQALNDMPPRLTAALSRMEIDLHSATQEPGMASPEQLAGRIQKGMHRRMFSGVLAVIAAVPLLIVVRRRPVD